MIEMPLPYPSNNPVKLSGGVMVFCVKSSYPRSLLRAVNVSGFAAAIGVHSQTCSGGHKGKEDEVYFRGFKLVGPCLPRDQPIQLHCFSGGAVAFAKWQKRFPHVYASFSGLVSSFEEHQTQGLRAVPGDRLMLETDSPYLPTVRLHLTSRGRCCST
ncbi:vacuolar protein sorting-associated protein 13d [Plakobranchus ocellatus]|uniref:Vacuolar protein sorting-associated protein 13d n=1 Tax=Plakobranchus ocellatus TaxID=259542 RepID=A0AAV4C2P8_9GAST|nr:vacuolar protein sorting-associated protein 13d [Plakobranchus ocellatus]